MSDSCPSGGRSFSAQTGLPSLLVTGLSFASLLVAVGRDHAVAVGVDGVLVGPVALAVGQAGLVELADRQHHVAAFGR